VRTLLFLLVVAIVVAVVVWLLRRRAAVTRTTPRDPFADPALINADLDLEGIAAGAVVALDGRDYVVRGTIRLDEEGFRWVEHLLDDTRDRCWLAVEDDEGLKVTQWWRRPLADVQGAPGDRTVELYGQRYALQEQGTASYTAEATTGTAPSGTASYADYRAGDGALLSFERFGTDWEVSVGTEVNPAGIVVYPSEDAARGGA
jgi:hypothetical protein